jgi:hypothetical protein
MLVYELTAWRKGESMGKRAGRRERQIVFRVDAVVYDQLKSMAAGLGFTLSEYCRVMVSLPWPYLGVLADVWRILKQAEERPGEMPALLQSALTRLDEGEAEVTALVERIQSWLPETQQASRDQLAALRVDLHAQVAELGAWQSAFATLRKRLEERREARA